MCQVNASGSSPKPPIGECTFALTSISFRLGGLFLERTGEIKQLKWHTRPIGYVGIMPPLPSCPKQKQQISATKSVRSGTNRSTF